MAILTLLAIETDIHAYRDHTGHWNRHGYRDRPGHRNRHGYRDRTGLETDIHLSGIEPGIDCKELVRE